MTMKTDKLKPDTKQNRSIVSFFLSLLLSLAFTWLVREPSFSQSQTYVLFLLLFSIGLWLTEAVPAFAVGLFNYSLFSFYSGL